MPPNTSIGASLLASRFESFGDSSKTPTYLLLPWERPPSHEMLAATLPDVMSEEECTDIIEKCEEQGFEPAKLAIGGYKQVLAPGVRKHERCIIDDVPAAEILWERLKQIVPDTITHHSKSWLPVGLNERLRVLKYKPGQYFHHHSDGSFVRPESNAPLPIGEQGDKSFFTVILYLNTPTSGGGTKFIDSSRNTEGNYVKPATGQALVFDHELQHEGVTVSEGLKYAIRTDVMYRCQDTKERSVDTATSVFLPTKRQAHGYMLKC